MPRVFRAMRKDQDGGPIVGQSASALGVRPRLDVDVDPSGQVLANGKGMSVSPTWRDITPLRIPKRLKHLMPDARGPANTFCFRFGEGPFQQDTIGDGLILHPDSATHGVVAPTETTPLANYEEALAATRTGWLEDES